MLIFGIIVAIIIIVFICTYPSLSKSNDLSKMIAKYKNDLLNPDCIREIYAYCKNNENLNRICIKHNATLQDFAAVYMYLVASCNVGGGGHLIPISTFFFMSSLDYALSNKNIWTEENNLWLMKYFNLI